MPADAGRDDDARVVPELFEVDVPDPRHVGAVGFAVVEADDEVLAVRELHGRAHRFVEAGGILGEHEDQVAAAKLDPLLAAERSLEGAQPLGDVRRREVDAARDGVRREHVVAVVETAEWHLDARAVDAQRNALEAVELDVRCCDFRFRPREVVIGAAVDAIVADVDRVEDEARSAPRAGPRVGSVREGLRGDRRVVQPVPKRLVREVQPDLGDARVVGVKDGPRGLRLRAERLLDLLGDRLELAVSVELIAKQVQHERRPRLDLCRRFREARLVDLENAPVRLQPAVGAGPVQRRRRGTEDEIRPGTVRHDPMARAFEQPAQQARGGRLAVGPGDDDRSVGQVLGEARQDLGVDRARDVARQRRAAASACDAAQRAGGLAGPNSRGFADHDQEPTAREIAVQHSSFPMACLPSSSVLTCLWNAEPLPVICHPGPRLAANCFRLGATCSAARRSWFGRSPLTSSHARYTSPVESSMPGHAIANQAASIGSGVRRSPWPSPCARPPTKKKGTSEPNSFAIGARSRSSAYIAFRALSAAAASELAPPMPEPGGIRLWRWKAAGSGLRAARSRAACAASTELSFVARLKPEIAIVVSSASETTSRSCRSMAWNIVRIW